MKKFLVFIILLILTFIIILIQLEKNLIPVAIDISKKYAVTEINNEINKALEDIIEKKGLTSRDFFENSFNDRQQMNYLEVDTLLINQVCAEAANQISKNLNLLKDKPIELPVGMMTGIHALYELGPDYTVEIMPVGNARVDYETEFKSVGINQVNFMVWLNIEADISIINTIHREDIKMKRKLMLVNTIFNGEVPKGIIGEELIKSEKEE